METEFNNLNINLGGSAGLSLGMLNADRADIDFLFNSLNLTAAQRIIVVDLWKRHPSRLRGILFTISMKKLNI
jgi:hypothetical protein